MVKKRLDADTVTCNDKLMLFAVPNRQREHSVDVLQKGFAALTIELQNDFGVRL